MNFLLLKMRECRARTRRLDVWIVAWLEQRRLATDPIGAASSDLHREDRVGVQDLLQCFGRLVPISDGGHLSFVGLGDMLRQRYDRHRAANVGLVKQLLPPSR